MELKKLIRKMLLESKGSNELSINPRNFKTMAHRFLNDSDLAKEADGVIYTLYNSEVSQGGGVYRQRYVPEIVVVSQIRFTDEQSDELQNRMNEYFGFFNIPECRVTVMTTDDFRYDQKIYSFLIFKNEKWTRPYYCLYKNGMETGVSIQHIVGLINWFNRNI